MICGIMDNRVWLTRESFERDVQHASVRRMDLQILCSKALSRDGAFANKLWWDLDKAGWASVAATTSRSFA
jgi:hypothetical protein